MERAEQCTVRHRFTMDWQEALNRWSIYSRGTLLQDSASNFYRVLVCNIQHQKPDTAILDITSEALSFDNPPDEFQITPVKLGLDIMKHPRYFYALMPTNQIPTPWPANVTADTDAQIAVKQAIIRAIQAYRENPFIPTAQAINNMVGALHDSITCNFVTGKGVYAVPNPNFNSNFPATAPIEVGGTVPAAATSASDANPQYYYAAYDSGTTDPNGKIALAMAAAREIIGKLWRMEDAPLVNGWEIVWSEYYWRPPFLNPGGYVENPMAASPALPDYFVSPAYIPDSTTIFDRLSVYNPQCFAVNGQYNGTVSISWLRDADTFEFQRTFFKVTHRWLGAPVGAWDADLYNQFNRPSSPSDYRSLILA